MGGLNSTKLNKREREERGNDTDTDTDTEETPETERGGEGGEGEERREKRKNYNGQSEKLLVCQVSFTILEGFPLLWGDKFEKRMECVGVVKMKGKGGKPLANQEEERRKKKKEEIS